MGHQEGEATESQPRADQTHDSPAALTELRSTQETGWGVGGRIRPSEEPDLSIAAPVSLATKHESSGDARRCRSPLLLEENTGGRGGRVGFPSVAPPQRQTTACCRAPPRPSCTWGLRRSLKSALQIKAFLAVQYKQGKNKGSRTALPYVAPPTSNVCAGPDPRLRAPPSGS